MDGVTPIDPESCSNRASGVRSPPDQLPCAGSQAWTTVTDPPPIADLTGRPSDGRRHLDRLRARLPLRAGRRVFPLPRSPSSRSVSPSCSSSNVAGSGAPGRRTRPQPQPLPLGRADRRDRRRVLLAAYGASSIAPDVAPLLSGLGLDRGAAEAVALVLMTLVIAYLSLVFGELVPKRSPCSARRASRWRCTHTRPLRDADANRSSGCCRRPPTPWSDCSAATRTPAASR